MIETSLKMRKCHDECCHVGSFNEYAFYHVGSFDEARPEGYSMNHHKDDICHVGKELKS